MNDLMDFLSRSPQIRLITRVMLVEGMAQSVLEIEPHLESLQPVNLAEIIAAKGGPNPRLKELMVARAAESFSGWVYVLHVVDRPARMPGTPERAVEVGGIALLRSDRVVKVLDRSGGQALLWLDGDPKEIVLSVPCPGDPTRTLSVHVTNGKISYQPFLIKQQLLYQVTLAGRVDLVNTECGVNVVDPVNRTLLEKQVCDHVTAQIRQAIDTFQETRTDPVAFGKRVELKYPAFWKANGPDWPKVWPKVPVKLSVQITIRNAGLLVAPANRSRYELENAKP